MFHLLGSIGLAYLGGTGVATNAAVIGRGLVRAARTAIDGEYGEAVVEVLGGLAAPALMSYSSITGLCSDVIAVAQELAAPALGEVFEEPTRQAA